MFTIKHASFEATVNPTGAELSSLMQVAHAGDKAELIWQGDEKFWTGRAPILFPIVGALRNGQMTHRGEQYSLPRHGLARHATFECIDHTESQITMRLLADSTSRSVYPWNFELQVQFMLSSTGLEIQYTVFNHDDNNMLFTIGSHPAFALQINDTHQFTDYAIAFNQPENFATYALTEDGLLETQPKSLYADGNSIALSEDIFNNDALVLRNINSTSVRLTKNNQTLLTVETGGAPHLGIWSKPGAPFVCIEPWLGTSDFVDSSGEFASKPDLTILPAGDTFSHAIKICLPET